MISEYLVNRPNISCVFVLIDSRHEPQEIDISFVQWLAENQIPFALVYTKGDKVKPGLVKKHIKLFQEAMSEWCEGEPEIFTTSSKSRDGRKELLTFVTELVEAR